MNAPSALFNPASNRLDAVRIGEAFHLSVEALASSMGCTDHELRMGPDALTLQSHLNRIVAIWLTITKLYAGREANAHTFLSAPNNHLEGRSPASFIEVGDFAPLEALMESMSFRQPA